MTVPWQETILGELKPDQCHMYDRNYSSFSPNITECTLPPDSVDSPIIDCTAWTYDSSEMGDTIVTQVR